MADERPEPAQDGTTLDLPPLDTTSDAEKSSDPSASSPLIGALQAFATRWKAQLISNIRSSNTQSASLGHQSCSSPDQLSPSTIVGELKCHICNIVLGIYPRRHHCRNCRLPVCGVHSQNQVPLPHLGFMKEVRVCDICVRHLFQRRAGYRSPRTKQRFSEAALDNYANSSKAPRSLDDACPAFHTTDIAPYNAEGSRKEAESSASAEPLCGILYSCTLEEQANIMDEIVYLGTFTMAGRSFASRSMSANVALWKDRMFMLTPAELLCFKSSDDSSALGEVRSCIHLTDILHVEADEQFPRILTIVRLDGRICRLRAKTAEQCLEILHVLERARDLFADAMHRLQRGTRPSEFSISCITVQHESSLPEYVVASSPAYNQSFQVDMYPSSILRLYVHGPNASGLALVSSETLYKAAEVSRNELIIDSEPMQNSVRNSEIMHIHLRSTRADKKKWKYQTPFLLAIVSVSLSLMYHHFLVSGCVLFLGLAFYFLATSYMSLALLATTKMIQHVRRFQILCSSIEAGVAEQDILDQDTIHEKDADVRFIEGCNGDTEEARRRFMQCMHWRRENAMDSAFSRPIPQFFLMKQAHPNYIHKRGKLGHIVTYEHLGSMKASREYWLSHNITEEQVIMYHMICQDYLWRVLDPRDFPEGTQIKILDIQGISMADVGGEVFAFMKTLGQTVALYNPERIHQIMILNPPSWFSLLWKLISPFVHPKTRERVQVLKGQKDIARVLLECIDSENLPQQYGGTCQCEGGCEAGAMEERDFREYVQKLNDGKDCAEDWAALCSKYQLIQETLVRKDT